MVSQSRVVVQSCYRTWKIGFSLTDRGRGRAGSASEKFEKWCHDLTAFPPSHFRLARLQIVSIKKLLHVRLGLKFVWWTNSTQGSAYPWLLVSWRRWSNVAEYFFSVEVWWSCSIHLRRSIIWTGFIRPALPAITKFSCGDPRETVGHDSVYHHTGNKLTCFSTRRLNRIVLWRYYYNKKDLIISSTPKVETSVLQ